MTEKLLSFQVQKVTHFLRAGTLILFASGRLVHKRRRGFDFIFRCDLVIELVI